MHTVFQYSFILIKNNHLKKKGELSYLNYKQNMDMTKLLIVIAVLGVIAIIILKIYDKNVKKSDKTAVNIKNNKTKTGHLYKFYKNFPLTAKTFSKTKQKVKILYPSDEFSINSRTAMDMSKGYAATLLCSLLVLFTFNGNLLYLCAGITVSAVIGIQFREGALRKSSKMLMSQMLKMVDLVIHRYGDGIHSVKDPADALSEAVEDMDYEIGLHIDHIFKIISSPDVDQRIDEYTDIAPNTYMQMFASICAVTQSNGDVIDDDGKSVFIKNLETLKSQIEAELLKMEELDFRFRAFNLVCLGATLFVKPIESWATSNMPEMSSFYSGSSGIKAMISIFAATIFCYNIILSIKNEKVPQSEEDSIWFKISNRQPFSSMLSLKLDSNFSKTEQIYDLLRLTGSQIGTKAFLMKRYVYGAVALVIMELILIFSVYKDKIEVITDFTASYDSSFVMDPEYEQTMKDLSAEIANELKNGTFQSSEIAGYIMKNTEIENEDYAALMGEEIAERITKYQQMYFQWIYVIYGAVAAYAGYMIPYALLLYKKKNVNIEMENEILQFQMVIMILMNRKDVTINTILEWMDKFSFCFKTSISECLMNIGNEKVALQKLKESESYQPFINIVDSLIAVDDSSVKVAFSQLDSNSDMLMAKRDLNNRILIEKLSKQGQLFAIIPIVLEIGLYLILPLILMSNDVLGSIQGSMTGTF